MLRVGLTGGLACGKTFVGEALAGLGCLLIGADDLGHAVLEPGAEAYDSVVREFGPEILDDGGRIDRARAGRAGFRRSPNGWPRSTAWCIRRWFAARKA